MHEAYSLGSLLKLPHAIQSMSAFGDFLLVGTKQGHLLMYSIKFLEPSSAGGSTSDGHLEAQVQLLKSNTDYKKPITQMDVLEIGLKQFILVVLCEGVVSVHYISQKELNVPNISAATRMSHSKGSASAFALDVVRQKTLTGEMSSVVRIAVALRKKLQFFYWKKEKFLELHPEMSIVYDVRSIAWCKGSVCIGFPGGYSLVKLNQGTGSESEICELFGGTRHERQAPTVAVLSDERFALVEDKITKLVDLEGNAKSGSGIMWSEPPFAITQDIPFLIGLLKKGVEIRSDSPAVLIQSFELTDPKIVCSHKQGFVFIASTSQVWFLRMVSISRQISQLLIDKQFELALRLCNLSTIDNTFQKYEKILEIQKLFAFYQFCNEQFKEAMDAFFKLDIDASHVIGLFPNLLPTEFCNQLKFPAQTPAFDEHTMEKAIESLIEYLTQVRHKLNGLHAKKFSNRLSEEGPMIESRSKMLEIIDTTLLKCYLQTNSKGLVASLLRLRDNHCHLEETEKTLKKHQKFNELIILYNTRGLHRKALTLMNDHLGKDDSPLGSYKKITDYLQNLSPEQIDIVCEFSSKVFEISEEDGLKIFTDDLLEVESWPRAKVLDFLTKNHKNVVVDYLEHVTTIWNETGSVFHNSLILQYKDIIVDILGQDDIVSRDLSDKLDNTTEKLRNLLSTSSSYTAETVIQQFPHDCLHSERAMLLGSMKKHTEALAINLYLVKDVEEAFKYCRRHDKPVVVGPDNVWTTLYRLLVQPPDGPMLLAMNLPRGIAIHKPDIPNALRVLRESGRQVDLNTVLLSTPTSVNLDQLASFLEVSMEKRVSKRHHVQLLKGLMQSQYLQMQEERIAIESQKITLSDMDYCPVCHKKFRNQGTLVCYPNKKVVHYSCQDRAMMVN